MRTLGALPLLLMAGCELMGSSQPAGRPVSEAYGGAQELRVLDIDSPLRREAQIPVLSTPEIFAVYVPSHADRELLIGEHWLFFKLREAQWFIERLQDPDPPVSGDAAAEQLRPLRDLNWARVVIPRKEGK